MTVRITQKQLEKMCERINDALGVPHEPYQTDNQGRMKRHADGRAAVNAGTVYLAGAYGGVRIEQMCEGGGCRDLLSSGYDTKRNVYNMAAAYLAGLEVRS